MSYGGRVFDLVPGHFFPAFVEEYDSRGSGADVDRDDQRYGVIQSVVWVHVVPFACSVGETPFQKQI